MTELGAAGPGEADVALLWAAAAPRPDLTEVAAAAAAADVEAVLHTARRQRVAPLVLRSLDRAGVEVDASLAGAGRESAFRRGQHLVGLPAVVEHALVPLHDAGVTPLVHKGAALVGRYPGVGLRPMDDVDVIVPPERMQHAIGALEAAGWRHGVHNLTTWEPGYDIPLVHPRTGGLPLEVHYDLQRRSQRTSRIDAALLWSERVPTAVCGQPVWGLQPELELLALATHAAKPYHVFNRLIWAVDVAVVTQAAELDWDAVGRRARRLQCRTAVAVALRLARRLGAAVPDDLVALPSVVGRSGVLEPLLEPAWPFTVEHRNRRGFALALVDTHRARSRLLVDEVRYPGEGRSPAHAVGDQLGSAVRAAQRVMARVPAGGRRRASTSRGGAGAPTAPPGSGG